MAVSLTLEIRGTGWEIIQLLKNCEEQIVVMTLLRGLIQLKCSPIFLVILRSTYFG